MRPTSESFLDTIAALATPAGRSALAVVRISGPQTRTIVARIAPGAPAVWEPRRATLVTIVGSDGRTIDRGLTTVFPGPASYTGEDAAEISVHGSPIVVEALLSELRRAGARMARPGEFTRRAFLNGKIDLPRAEAIHELIEARTGRAADASMRRLFGALSRRFEGIRAALLSAAAGLNAAVDFSEDVGEALPSGVETNVAAAAAELERLVSTAAAGQRLSAGCRVAIVGRPNAGKSTLFNALAGSARAIVTDVAGTTRDTLEVEIEIDGIPVVIVDTAGLRATEDAVEKIGVARAREAAERADVVLEVIDATADAVPSDVGGASEPQEGRPVLRIANKTDRATPESVAAIGETALAICGLAPDAGERLRALLSREIGARVETESTSEVLASLRQRDLASRAQRAAAAALESLHRRESPEYAAALVHESLDALADLFGETTTEDVLARIFSEFCIGK